ncbi:hypothetical protein CapIbe_005264 [Capra ibex]
MRGGARSRWVTGSVSASPKRGPQASRVARCLFPVRRPETFPSLPGPPSPPSALLAFPAGPSMRAGSLLLSLGPGDPRSSAIRSWPGSDPARQPPPPQR